MRIQTMIVMLAAIMAAAAADARGSNQAFSVPFEFYRGHIYVSALVNGKGPYRFVFDTGASGIGRADRRLVEELSLKTIGQVQNDDGVNVATMATVSADSLRLGSLEKRHIELQSRDYNAHRKPGEAPVMGIIGRDFFKDRLLTIDYPNRRLSFTRGSLHRGDAGAIGYKSSFAIPVCFASSCFEGKVDSGSSHSLVVPKAVVGKIATTPPVRSGSGTSANTVFEMYQMQSLQPVRVSGVTALNQKIEYSEPSESTINIGSDFLKDYVLTIDQRHHLLRISKPQAR